MSIPEYAAFPGDPACKNWYINRYVKDEAGDLRRDTPWEGMPGAKAKQLAAILNDCARYESYVKPPAVMYAIGYEEKPGSYGMAHGPNPNKDAMLDVVPDYNGRQPYIFEFMPDGSDKRIYAWDTETEDWKPFNDKE